MSRKQRKRKQMQRRNAYIKKYGYEQVKELQATPSRQRKSKS